MRKIRKLNTIVFILILIIIALVAYIYFKDHPFPSFSSFFKKDVDKVVVEQASIQKDEVEAKITLKSTIKKITKEDTHYIVNAEYPVLSGISDKIVLQKINSEIKLKVEEKINDFIMNTENADSYEKNSDKNELSIGVHEYLVAHGVVSVIMRVSDYQVGTAHPESYGYTMNFNIRDGNVLLFSDLFKSDSKYLTTISKLCVDQLKKQLKPDESGLIWIKSGASSNPDNFVDYKVTEDSLVVYFNPYQVSSYTNGIVQVPIPLSSISDIINSEVIVK